MHFLLYVYQQRILDQYLNNVKAPVSRGNSIFDKKPFKGRIYSYKSPRAVNSKKGARLTYWFVTKFIGTRLKIVIRLASSALLHLQPTIIYFQSSDDRLLKWYPHNVDWILTSSGVIVSASYLAENADSALRKQWLRFGYRPFYRRSGSCKSYDWEQIAQRE